jgi:hypothetical protein
MSASVSPPPSQISPVSSRRRYGRWILLAVVALIALGIYRFGPAIYSTASFVVGRPYLPGCATSVTKDETVGDIRYRISAQKCDDGTTRHYVFVARAQSSMSFMMTPAFLSIDSPVPLDVTREGERTYYISIAPALADGATILELFIGPSGAPLRTHIFNKGQKR